MEGAGSLLEESDPCMKEVEKIVKLQSVDYRLNKALERACRPTVTARCGQYAQEDIDNGDVMQCLLKNRDDRETMTDKCRTYIDHYELVSSLCSLRLGISVIHSTQISMRDYHFTPRFAKACKKDIAEHCIDAPKDKCVLRLLLSHTIRAINGLSLSRASY